MYVPFKLKMCWNPAELCPLISYAGQRSPGRLKAGKGHAGKLKTPGLPYVEQSGVCCTKARGNYWMSMLDHSGECDPD